MSKENPVAKPIKMSKQTAASVARIWDRVERESALEQAEKEKQDALQLEERLRILAEEEGKRKVRKAEARKRKAEKKAEAQKTQPKRRAPKGFPLSIPVYINADNGDVSLRIFETIEDAKDYAQEQSESGSSSLDGEVRTIDVVVDSKGNLIGGFAEDGD